MPEPTNSHTKDGAVAHAPDVNAEIAESPLATPADRKKRSSLIHQAARFTVLNLKILKLARQEH